MIIIQDQIKIRVLKEMAQAGFGDMVKGVVDIEKGLLALDAELHADLEALLLEQGSHQKNLWGINLYPDLSGDDFVEFDSMINVRPSQNNRGRGVDNIEIQKQILALVEKRVLR